MRSYDARAKLLCDRISDRVDAICEAVPPIKPGAQYWLDSDAGPSYCRKCAIVARGKDFELGPPIEDRAFYWRTDMEAAFFAGIDGGFDTEEDSARACETCGTTLSYILTDYGVEHEIDFYREAPLFAVRDEDSYALDRLALNIFPGSPRHLILGVAIAVNQAWRILQHDGASA